MSLYIGLEVPSSRGSKSPIWYSNLKWRCLREIQVRMEGLIIYIYLNSLIAPISLHLIISSQNIIILKIQLFFWRIYYSYNKFYNNFISMIFFLSIYI